MKNPCLLQAFACRLQAVPHMGHTQVQVTRAPFKHFGPLKGGCGVWGRGDQNHPFFEPLWCLGNIHTRVPRAATSRSTHAKGNLADHLIMISTHIISHKPCYEQSGMDAVA